MKLAAGRRSADVWLPNDVVLSREAFDMALIREAEVAGEIFAPGTHIKLEDDSREDFRTLSLGNGQVLAARVVILATGLAGAKSQVEEGSRIGAGVIVPAEVVPEFFESNTLYMATGRGGYVGLVRLEDNCLDIGAAFDAAFVRRSGGLGAAAAAILDETGWPAIPGLAHLGEHHHGIEHDDAGTHHNRACYTGRARRP